MAVGGAGQGGVGEGGQVRDELIKSERKPSRRVVVTGKNIGDGRATFLTGIPGFNDGGSVLLRPIHGQRAAVREDHDEWLSSGGDGFQKLLLGPRKIEVKAIAAEKTGIA